MVAMRAAGEIADIDRAEIARPVARDRRAVAGQVGDVARGLEAAVAIRVGEDGEAESRAGAAGGGDSGAVAASLHSGR